MAMFNFSFAALAAVAAAKTCDITNYGASESSGSSSNSKAIVAAIEDCLSGGEVIVPKGTFTTKPFVIRGGEDLTFTLSKGSSLQGVSRSSWPSADGKTYDTFFEINDCHRCTLRGAGTLDGKGTPWYKDFDAGKISKHRPEFVVVQGGSHVKILDLTLHNAPMINLKLKGVDTVEVGHINIIADWYNDGTTEPHNTDAINPGHGTKHAWIHDVFVSNGDDGIAVKPGDIGACTRDILVENSRFERGHGLSIGSVGEGCVENVYFRNNTVTGKDTQNGVRIKTYRNKPGYIKNITYEDIDIYKTKHCISINQDYGISGSLDAKESDVELMNVTSASTNSIEVTDVNFINIRSSSCSVDAEFLCDSNKACTGLYLKDVQVSGGHGMSCSNAYGVAKNSISSCLKSGGPSPHPPPFGFSSEVTLV